MKALEVLEERYPLMGQVITVYEQYVRRRMGHERTWIPQKLQHPRAGWVVRYTKIQNGLYYPESPYCQAGLTSIVSVPCLMVTWWPRHKESVRVPLLTGAYVVGGVPMSDSRFYLDVVCPESRADLADIMREEMKNWPRDEKGRWRKYRL